MKFNETFEEFMNLYSESMGSAMRDLDKISGQQEADKVYGAIHAEVEGGKSVEEVLGDMNYPEHSFKVMAISYKNWLASSSPTEDNELVKGAAKLAGKAALGAAKLAGKGVKEVAHFATDDQFRGKQEDCESCGCSDEEVEDCETCGCEENPEYGHFNDKYSDYIDQYEEPAEDAERIDKDRMKCNSPKRGGSKKFVVKACENGKEKIVRFGDPNMKIRKSNPKARKSFRARHKCDQKKSKFSAGYWSCKKW